MSTANDDRLNLATLRAEDALSSLEREALAKEPSDQLRRWLEEAHAAGEPEANAMVLATADSAGRPSARAVLLKGLDRDGLSFYSHFESRKGREMEANPNAAVCFLWHRLQRQVRVEGSIERLGEITSAAYFASRPRGSQLGAWASPQSQVLDGRDTLETRYRQAAARFADRAVPKPAGWGGFRLCPHSFEFWQGRASRLHDRFRYRPADPAGWRIERLAP